MPEIEQLKLDEGFRSTPYRCSEGKLTVGYGLNLEAGITEEEAAAILTMRVSAVHKELKSKLSWLTFAPSEVNNVLVNMAYQLGITGVLKFKQTLKHLEAQEYGYAAMEMLDSKWARQTPDRAKRLADRIQAMVV